MTKEKPIQESKEQCPYLLVERLNQIYDNQRIVDYGKSELRCSINDKTCIATREHVELGVHDDNYWTEYHHELTENCLALKLIEMGYVDVVSLNKKIKENQDIKTKRRNKLIAEIERRRKEEYRKEEKVRRAKRKVELAQVIEDSKKELSFLRGIIDAK